MVWRPNVSIRFIQGKGRGVVANVDLRRGQLVEVCPLIAVVPHTRVFDNWELAWGHNKVALVGGNAHLYNHSKNSNARFKRDLVHGEIRVYAKRRIAAGEELTIRYLCDLWFKEVR